MRRCGIHKYDPLTLVCVNCHQTQEHIIDTMDGLRPLLVSDRQFAQEMAQMVLDAAARR